MLGVAGVQIFHKEGRLGRALEEQLIHLSSEGFGRNFRGIILCTIRGIVFSPSLGGVTKSKTEWNDVNALRVNPHSVKTERYQGLGTKAFLKIAVRHDSGA